MSRPLQLSAETAVRLAKELNIPLEHLMHMPRHILLQKMAELAKNAPDTSNDAESAPDPQQGDSHDPV
ncbi:MULTISPECIES: YycC family protein [unclassified Paenibacillus]|uniref:YycC family protein n=1 Tax=unclassified Paenibacillus TaxID=185978 RepID=UPI000954F00D|nr:MULTISPECIES: YycC family protein [unclassified Paenibacillus]ASS68850.1 YycC family protein [Paenibacillus sp. RUD330]SIR18050.1 YycC-like protein [Paenibacillus sp. RU4X]SIR20913.1 YycC-like protein [Paenibacillus sp. RU4T]